MSKFGGVLEYVATRNLKTLANFFNFPYQTLGIVMI